MVKIGALVLGSSTINQLFLESYGPLTQPFLHIYELCGISVYEMKTIYMHSY